MNIKDEDQAAIRPFMQHGFRPEGASGDTEIYGQCPFCFKAGKFYVNKKTHQWSCKSCGMEGGFQRFLARIAEHCQKYFKGENARWLVESRGISEETFREAGVGYNELTKSYTIPVYDQRGVILNWSA